MNYGEAKDDLPHFVDGEVEISHDIRAEGRDMWE